MIDVRVVPVSGIVTEDRPTPQHAVADRSVRSYAPLIPLLDDLIAHPPGDPRRAAARADLATGFLPLVRNIARRDVQRGEPLEDLQQVGSVGLLVVLDRFDPAPGSDVMAAFLGYAVPSVAGRSAATSGTGPGRCASPAGSRTCRHRCVRPRPTCRSRSTAPPGPVRSRRGSAAPWRTCSRPCGPRTATGPRPSTPAPIRPGPHSVGSTRRSAGSSTAALCGRRSAGRPSGSSGFLRMRFFDDLTQTQIAAQVGLSQMQISRILRQTLDQVRRQLATT